MTEPFAPAMVRIFTAPETSCGTEMTWATATAFMRERLHRQFGEGVAVEYIGLFSQRSFEFPTVLEAVRGGAHLPIILVGDQIISHGEKLSESRISRAIEALRASAGSPPRRE